MKINPARLPNSLTACLKLVAIAFLVPGIGLADASQSAFTDAQVEADWLRQDELRKMPGAAVGQPPTREEDARGGCDGVKNGQWGFHTENEPRPWWQVDLGKPFALGRVLLFNRCDGFAERNSRVLVLVSADAETWQKIYEHDGATFYGHSDGQPLVVSLGGVTARHLRLQLPGTNYFHLDEVEIYGAEEGRNLALAKPATQSSISPWSVRHPGAVGGRTYPTRLVMERGRRLSDRLGTLGATLSDETRLLDEVSQELESVPADAPESRQRQLYLKARWAVRRMALQNPLLDFDRVVFAKNAAPMFPHMSDQFYGWWSKPGGGIWLLEGLKSRQPQVRCLTGSWAPGSFVRPDLSFDGQRVLFAYAKYYPHVRDMDKVDKTRLPEDSFYHLFELNLQTLQARPLTGGRYDDFDARYLPGGEIVFLSTRKGQFLQCNPQNLSATYRETLPDSYVRCGGGNHRPVAVFTLHAINADGGGLRPVSAFENFEWTPAVSADGSILYARWDYIDRFNGHFMSLWSTNPDGFNPQLIYGNFTVRPQCVFEAVPVPHSSKLVFTACAHHSNLGGSLVLLDRTYGTEEERPLTRLTPEVCFPETEGWPDHYYVNPHPLAEEFFLVAWSDRRLPPHTLCAVNDPNNPDNATGIYLYDAFGNLELLHRDPAIASMNPIPVRSRPKPPVLPADVAWDGPQEGRFLLQDVYRGLAGFGPGTVKTLRIVAIPPKVQPHMDNPSLGVSAEDPGKFVLGTAPVEPDGSAFFRVPSGVPVFLQALDAQGRTLQTMRSLTYVHPGQTLSCVGCHESRDLAPPIRQFPQAARREPSRLQPGPGGSWPLRYDQLVQPVLDRLCVECHRPDAADPAAARLDLTPARSYQSLITYAGEDLKKLAFEQPQSFVGESPSLKSKLFALLTQAQGHVGVRLDPDAYACLVTWLDVYAQRLGSFSEAQEVELRGFRRRCADLLNPEP